MYPQQPATHPEPEPATHAEPHPATHPELYQPPQPPSHAEPHQAPQPPAHVEPHQAPQPAPQPVTHPELYQAPLHADPHPATHPELYQAPQPEQAQAPQPAPAATHIAGHEAPASGPPITTPAGYAPASGPPPVTPAGYAPASGPPVITPAGPEAPVSGPSIAGPAEFPPPSPPPPPPGRTAFRILVAVAVVLAAAIVVTATLGWSAVSDLRQGVSEREATQARIAQQEEAAARKVPEDFRSAGLESKLQRVKDLDKAADVAFNAWRDGGIRLGLLDEAMDDCNDAVIAYDVAAAPFPDQLFTALPKRIDLKNRETDCGRAFTGNI